MYDATLNDSQYSKDSYEHHSSDEISGIPIMEVESISLKTHIMYNCKSKFMNYLIDVIVLIITILALLRIIYFECQITTLIVIDIMDDYLSGSKITFWLILAQIYNHLLVVLVLWEAVAKDELLVVLIILTNIMTNSCYWNQLKFMPHHFIINFITNIIHIIFLKKCGLHFKGNYYTLLLIEFLLNYIPIIIFQILIMISGKTYITLSTKKFSADSSHMRLDFSNGIYIHLYTIDGICVIARGYNSYNRKSIVKNLYIPTQNYGIINIDKTKDGESISELLTKDIQTVKNTMIKICENVYPNLPILKWWVNDITNELNMSTKIKYRKGSNDCQRFAMSLADNNWEIIPNFVNTDIKNIGFPMMIILCIEFMYCFIY